MFLSALDQPIFFLVARLHIIQQKMAPCGSSFVLQRNLALIGPPGSGKGSYGRLLAQAWKVPLVTVSDVLRQHSSHPLDSGTLVEDATVSGLLQQHLPSSCYLLDGFPRTLGQVQLMEKTWPLHMQVHAVASLEVPKQVCREKMVGRRTCSECGQHYNVAAVNTLGFHLPAQRPMDCACGERFLSTRADDVPDIIETRLEAHYASTEPILNRFDERGRLLRFAPYQGYDDVPRFQKALETWLTNLQEQDDGLQR